MVWLHQLAAEDAAISYSSLFLEPWGTSPSTDKVLFNLAWINARTLRYLFNLSLQFACLKIDYPHQFPLQNEGVAGVCFKAFNRCWEELVVFPFRVVGLDNLDFNIKCHSRSFWGANMADGGATRYLGEVTEKYGPPKWISAHFNNHDQNCLLFLVPSLPARCSVTGMSTKTPGTSCKSRPWALKRAPSIPSVGATLSWYLRTDNSEFRGFQFAHVFDAFSNGYQSYQLMVRWWLSDNPKWQPGNRISNGWNQLSTWRIRGSMRTLQPSTSVTAQMPTRRMPRFSWHFTRHWKMGRWASRPFCLHEWNSRDEIVWNPGMHANDSSSSSLSSSSSSPPPPLG